MSSIARRLTAGFVSGALLVSSASAAANTVPASAISPWTALSALGTQASATSLCGSSVAASAAATAQAPRPGCVLPAADAAPVPVADVAPPLAPVEGGVGISPLVLGLAGLALAGLIYLILSDDPQSRSPD